MKWTHEDYLNAPQWFIQILSDIMNAEAEQHNKKK